MSVKLILKPSNEHNFPISSQTTISIDSIKSQLRSPQKKSKAIIDLNSEFTLDYLPPLLLSPHSSTIPESSSSPLLNNQNHNQEKIIKIIDIKYFISAQINIKPEALSLYMFNPSTLNKFQLLHDFEEFISYNPNDPKSNNNRKRKYSASTSDDGKQRVLYFKISQQKQKISIDIFQNNIDKLILDIPYNCSIYILKNLINIKLCSNIPLEHFTIYGVGYVDNNTNARKSPLNKALTNKLFTDEMLIEEIVQYYSSDHNQTSNREDRSNYILNMILIKKTKIRCIMGLDFRFNFMKNFIKFSFDNNAPSYREASDGLNLFFYCNNPHCDISHDYYIVVKGYGHFDIMEEINSIKCPKCYSVKKDLRNLGFIKSKWKYNGILKNKKDSRIEGDGLTLDNMLYVFHEVLFGSQFQILIIEAEAYVTYRVINRNNDINNASNDHDSSSDLNDISLFYPQNNQNENNDKEKVMNNFQCDFMQRNNENIIKNEIRSINPKNDPDDIIIEGKDKKTSYGCFLFFTDNERANANNKSCCCLIV